MMNYAILGGGRLARHMSHYLSLLGIAHSNWSRDPHSLLNTHRQKNAKSRLEATLEDASHALLLVSDGAIMDLLKRYPFLHEKVLVHCSGSQSFPGVAGAHPLMTFSASLYPLEQYRRIPFMVDSGYQFAEILPGLPNSHFPIGVEDKPRYHALCVMAGNFTQILWKAAGERFNKMGLPASSLLPYLEQVSANFADHPDSALTGPLSRGDHGTVERNLKSLESDPLHAVYQSFLDLYRSDAPSRESNSQQAKWPREATS